VSVAELQSAWRWLRAQEEATGRAQVRPGGGWWPAERVLPVLGAVGGCGSTALALAVATAWGGPARLVECAGGRSGLVAACESELGEVDGWRRGQRGPVLVDRFGVGAASGPVPMPVPPPAPPPVRLSVLDVGATGLGPGRSAGWAAATVASAPAVLVAAPATVPGLRWAEVLLEQGRLADRAVLGVVGRGRRSWPRDLRPAVGPLTEQTQQAGRLVAVPWQAGLHRRGLDGAELPPPLLAAAAAVLRAVDGIGPAAADAGGAEQTREGEVA
jgi:hypothetical protein